MKNNKKFKHIRGTGMVMGVGLMLVVVVLAGYYFGSFLDKKLNTTPWLSIIGLFLGFIGGCIETYRIASKL
jgi:F0F1-type ATP synthase assembly protein I